MCSSVVLPDPLVPTDDRNDAAIGTDVLFFQIDKSNSHGNPRVKPSLLLSNKRD
jgi:hypothetical protein